MITCARHAGQFERGKESEERWEEGKAGGGEGVEGGQGMGRRKEERWEVGKTKG